MVHYKCDTLEEFMFNTTQLLNTGKIFEISVYKTFQNKNVSGVLKGSRPIDSEHITYSITNKSNRKESDPFSMSIDIIDITTKKSLRLLLKQLLLEDGWKRVGKNHDIIR